MTSLSTGRWADPAGTAVSAACAAHCAAIATAPSLLPLAGLGFLMDGPWELILWGMATGLALLSVTTAPRSRRTVALSAAFVAGIGLLFVGRLLESGGPELAALPANVLGGVVLVGAHVGSIRASRQDARSDCDKDTGPRDGAGTHRSTP